MPDIDELFFFGGLAKILILLELGDFDIGSSSQNITDKGLTRKIFWNKELGEDSAASNPETAEDSLLDNSRTVPVCAVCILSKGCSSQELGYLLWRAVGNS